MKSIHIFGARGKIESTYGVSASPANTDAILLAENPKLAIGYANDGKRGTPAGTMGNQKAATPSGRTGETTLKIEPRGAGAAYSSSVLPNMNAVLRSAGWDLTIDTSSAHEKAIYSLTAGPLNFASMSWDLFGRGEQYSVLGAFGDFTLGSTGPNIPMLEVPIKGKLPTIADASLPALDYGTTGGIMPPKVTETGFSFNGVTSLNWKDWSVKLARVINARMGGRLGYAVGRRVPVLEFTVENEALSTIDFYALRDSATPCPWALAIGSVQYNRSELAAPLAQVLTVSDEDEDPLAQIKVTCALLPSVFGLNDELTWTHD